MGSAYAASVVAHVEPGCAVWSKSRGTEGAGEDGSQLAPVGGTVIAVEEDRDFETGDIRRIFRVASGGHRLRLHHLDESDVDPALIEPFSTNRLEKAVLAMAEAVARNEKGARKRKLDIPDDVELVRDMGRLVGLVMGGAL